MDVVSLWNDQIPAKDGQKMSVNDIAFSPDGQKVVVAVENRVLLYRASDGDLINSLRAHQGTVYSVSFSSDGSRFASGGADNMVVIWKSTGQGLLRYSHGAPIQRVKYNPSLLLLASCSEVDFGLWTPDQKQVTKEKVPSRILSACWSTDGAILALGMLNGMVSLRNQQAEELLRFERKGPIWTLAFIPESPSPGSRGAATNSSTSLLDHTDNLAIGCWDKTYSLYKLTAKSALMNVEKHLTYYPLSMHCVSNPSLKMSYMVVSGSNKQVIVLSREGVKLAEATRPRDSWIWAADSFVEGDALVFGSQFGAIDALKVDFQSVHCLYKDRYAFRENLTEVIVHHLGTEKKVRIKCKDMIHNLSLYRNKLAVQLLDRVCVYESNAEDSVDIHFRLKKERVMLAGIARSSQDRDAKIVNNLLAAAALHVFSATEQVLEMYNMESAKRERIWQLSSKIQSLRVDGGPEGREAVLVGLADGKILRIFVDKPFPVEIAKRSRAVNVLDLSLHREMLATVDCDGELVVSDISTQESIFTLAGVRYASFNSEVEGLLSVTLAATGGVAVVSGLAVKGAAGSTSGSPEMHEQHLQGRVLGFRGQRVFALVRGQMSPLDVPQSGNIQRALDQGDFEAAYRSACLGATEADWRLLSMRALRANRLEVAKCGFARLKDTRFLSLIENAQRDRPTETPMVAATKSRERGRRDKERDPASLLPIAIVQPPLDAKWLSEAMAFEGHFHESSKILLRAGRSEEAVALFTLLRRWEDAKSVARSTLGDRAADRVSLLTTQQAAWLQEIKDWKGAAELFSSMGNHAQAARVAAEHEGHSNWVSVMLEVVRACPADDKETLHFCGEKLSGAEDVAPAREAFTKCRDFASLMSLYVGRKMWNDAAKLADEYAGQFDMSVFKSYAEWLVSQDRYEEAMDAFRKSGRSDLARKVLSELTANAVLEKRFKDAAYYYWMLAKDVEQETLSNTIQKESLESLSMIQSEYEHKADLYYAYSNIHSFVTDPFTAFQPEMLFQVSRFIVNSLGNSDELPMGISNTATLYTLAKQAMHLGAFKLARNAYDRLSRLTIPERRVDEVELDMLLVQAKPVRDDQDILPVCYRCGTTNPLLNPFTNRFAKGDVCTNCGHPFVRSFINFDVLPLVEFVPEPNISDEEAVDLIRQPPKGFRMGLGSRAASESKYEGANVLSLHDDADQSMYGGGGGDLDGADLFSHCLNYTLERQKNVYVPVQVDASALVAMKRSEVFVCRPSSSKKRATFYKNMLPDIPIAISQPCHRFFHLEDFEFAYLSEKKCPYSRLVNIGEYGSI